MPIKIKPVLLVFLVLCILSWQSLNAAVIDDLYDAQIAVADQSEQTQNKAFSLALQQVLIKVRGKDDLLTDQKIKKAITKATRFVRSYSYDIKGSQLYLRISFDPQRVESIVRGAGFPVWDRRRPDSLIWLAIQPSDDSARQTMGQVEYIEIYRQLSLRAEQRGITLMFPLWDLDDVQSLSVFDIWGGFIAQITQASERYAVPSVLSARIYVDNNSSDNAQTSVVLNKNSMPSWSADWTMIEGGGLLAGQVQGDSLLIIADGLIDELADQLSLKYAIDLTQVNRADTKVQIVINNIDSLIHYSQALNSLENMSVVNDVTLIKQQGPRATFELELLGDIKDLTNALNLDNKIKPVVDSFGQPISGLEFFWLK